MSDTDKLGTNYFQTSFTVTNASAEILPYRRNPRDILIQNNDPAGIVYINLTTTATASNTMFKVKADGGTLDLKRCRNAVNAIGSIVSNANVAVAEGRK